MAYSQLESLGVYGQNANLPFRKTELPIHQTADDESRMLINLGNGVWFDLLMQGCNLAFVQAPIIKPNL